jgi:mRNA interferase MazF
VTRGDVYRFNLDPTVGSEIKKSRPCVVVMADPNGKSPVTIVCPLTDANGKPGNLLNPFVPGGVGGTTKDSRVCCNQIRTLDKFRVMNGKLGDLPSDIMAKVSKGLTAILGL